MKALKMKNSHWCLLCSLVVWVFLFCLAFQKAWAQDSVSAQKAKILKSDAPLHVVSDRMEANQKNRTILFQGHVVVQQEDLTITGNKLTVYAAQGDEDKDKSKDSLGVTMDKIDRIVMVGDVRISQEDKVAVADKAVYYHEKQVIVLSGNPRVSQGKDTVRGHVITLYLTEERSVVEGSKQDPVQVTLHPSRKK
jgi:lipopolysaccharide export system protein LptA